MSERLTTDEDADLRRLYALAELGVLAGDTARLYEELRGRDRRAVVRPPTDLAIPLQNAGRDAGPVLYSA
jgi:hypothetical protein